MSQVFEHRDTRIVNGKVFNLAPSDVVFHAVENNDYTLTLRIGQEFDPFWIAKCGSPGFISEEHETPEEALADLQDLVEVYKERITL